MAVKVIESDKIKAQLFDKFIEMYEAYRGSNESSWKFIDSVHANIIGDYMLLVEYGIIDEAGKVKKKEDPDVPEMPSVADILDSLEEATNDFFGKYTNNESDKSDNPYQE